MKVLWFSFFVPYPPRGGNLQRSFNLIRQISKSYDVYLIAFNQQGYTRQFLLKAEQELKKYCSGVEFWQLPYRWRGPMWWIRLLCSPLWRAPFASRAVWSPKLAERWRRTLEVHPGALLHYDSPDVGLFQAAPGFRKILNHHNCESALIERQAEAESNFFKKFYLRMYARKQAGLERDICGTFDVNVAVSELDVENLRKKCPQAHFHVVENGTDLDYFHPIKDEEEPMSLVFAASLDWHPNVSAVEYFAAEVWPLLKRKCAAAKLFLAGRNPAPGILQLANSDPGIIVEANPEDTRPWLARGSVYICPIREGGGTRLKLLDAMAMGKAIVSTSVGCEGLEVKNGEHLMIVDSPQEFADVTFRLMEDGVLRRKLGEAGRTLIEERYGWQRISTRLEEAYRCAIDPGSCALRKVQGRQASYSPTAS